MTVTEKTARSVTEFMDDPISFFGQSYTQMHSISRDELEALQRQAMGIRFQQHREQHRDAAQAGRPARDHRP